MDVYFKFFFCAFLVPLLKPWILKYFSPVFVFCVCELNIETCVVLSVRKCGHGGHSSRTPEADMTEKKRILLKLKVTKWNLNKQTPNIKTCKRKEKTEDLESNSLVTTAFLVPLVVTRCVKFVICIFHIIRFVMSNTSLWLDKNPKFKLTDNKTESVKRKKWMKMNN